MLRISMRQGLGSLAATQLKLQAPGYCHLKRWLAGKYCQVCRCACAQKGVLSLRLVSVSKGLTISRIPTFSQAGKSRGVAWRGLD